LKVLVVGSGGREHALCWKLRQSPLLEELYCAPGNPGIGEIADLVPIAVDEIQNLADFAVEMKIDLTIVGPELPLTLGIVDQFEELGLRIFGPSRQAAILEGSKVFAKEFMRRHGIPTADFEVVHDAEEAREAMRRLGLPLVMKADGLAAGKGVLIVRDDTDAEEALKVFFEDRQFGGAGDRVVVEECLDGEEVSFIVLSDGKHMLTFASSKDYKRIGEDDTGPNTGGMGAHSPSVVLSKEEGTQILEQVMRPTVEGMANDNRPFSGVLYAGVMLTVDGPKVLEFNVRFGDPEAQPLFVRLEDDLLPILASGADGRFEVQRLHFRPEATACIVLASAGYPGAPAKGDPITGIDAARALDGVEVFHAGTKLDEGQLVASGGRVLNVCGSGPALQEALKRAYSGTAEIHWAHKIFRSDIGRRVLPRQTGAG
jgi:phosphoribosylamine--glycine ligase